MKMLSTGQPSTLGNYRALCSSMGFAKAFKFFEDKIAQQGPDEEVVADESQMIALIMQIESNREANQPS